jgi:hypothetical protein
MSSNLFFMHFQDEKQKKIPNMNSLHQMKSFDTKIDCFGG